MQFSVVVLAFLAIGAIEPFSPKRPIDMGGHPINNLAASTLASDAARRDYVASLQTMTDGATITLAWKNGSTNTVTLGGNRTLAISGTPKNGESVIIRFKQDATGGRTITWPTSGVTINWPLGEEPLLTTEPGRADAIIITCFDETPGALVFDAYPMPFNLY